MDFNIQNMTVVEKMQAMEILWGDLCRNAKDLAPPAWHEKILQERAAQLRQNKDKFEDWDQAKKDIWKSVS